MRGVAKVAGVVIHKRQPASQPAREMKTVVINAPATTLETWVVSPRNRGQPAAFQVTQRPGK